MMKIDNNDNNDNGSDNDKQGLGSMCLGTAGNCK